MGVLYSLVKAMLARDGSKPAGSEARGKGRERGHFIETTPRPPVAQRAGGIVCLLQQRRSALLLMDQMRNCIRVFILKSNLVLMSCP